jgi:prepilin peptidase CpaA
MTPTDPGFLSATLIVAAVAAAFDWRQRRIPNWLTLGALVSAPIAHAIHAHATHASALGAAETSLLGAALCGAVPLLLWRLHAIGGGDVKLVAAVGALAGPAFGIEAVFYACAFATGFVMVVLSWNGALLRTLASGAAQIVNPLLPEGRRVAARHELTDSFRFGPAVCAGVAFASLLHGVLS